MYFSFRLTLMFPIFFPRLHTWLKKMSHQNSQCSCCCCGCCGCSGHISGSCGPCCGQRCGRCCGQCCGRCCGVRFSIERSQRSTGCCGDSTVEYCFGQCGGYCSSFCGCISGYWRLMWRRIFSRRSARGRCAEEDNVGTFHWNQNYDGQNPLPMTISDSPVQQNQLASPIYAPTYIPAVKS